MSFSLTGPFTFRMMDRVESSMNSTRTWVTPPRLPVLPRTFVTFASLTGTLVVSCGHGRGAEWRRSAGSGLHRATAARARLEAAEAQLAHEHSPFWLRRVCCAVGG